MWPDKSRGFVKITLLSILSVGLTGCVETHRAPPPSYGEQDVQEFVRPGRTIAEITNRFGVPAAVVTNDGHVVMLFCNPIAFTNREVHPFGFSASFTNGMIENWKRSQITFRMTQ
jgi:hypothetical protein